MMQILILGGTQFIGRHVVEALLAAGHAVTILTRGKTPDELPEAVERLRGDRDAGVGGLDALGDRTWDVCVDVSGYLPRQVRPSAELLQDRVKRYVFVSSVSVYGDISTHPVREEYPVLPPAAETVAVIDGDTYGPLKVTCENIVMGIYGECATLLRPQTVAGPYDPSGRYSYWVNRVQRDGEMLAPGDGSDHVQVIDVRDLAQFVVTVVENDIGGVFNMAGPRLTWKQFLSVLGAENLVWVPHTILKPENLSFVELPLYRSESEPDSRSTLMDIDTSRAQAVGFITTDPAVTARDTEEWSRSQEFPESIAPEREAELIRRARQTSQ